ncbi:MAG: hypothetical protein ACFBRM_14045 [Pikeienuella sp.]
MRAPDKACAAIRATCLALLVVAGLGPALMAAPSEAGTLLRLETDPDAADAVAEVLQARLRVLEIDGEAAIGEDGLTVRLPRGIAATEVTAELIRPARLAVHALSLLAPPEGCPETLLCLPDPLSPPGRVALEAEALLAGSLVARAQAAKTDFGAAVHLRLTSDAAQAFCGLTEAHIGRDLALLLDETLLLYARLQAPICGGEVQIQGLGRDVEALAKQLSLPPLPAPVTLVEIKAIQPPSQTWGEAWRRGLEALRIPPRTTPEISD